LDAHRSELEREPDLNESRFSDEGPERLDRLQVHLNRLDADTRELIMLRFYSELSFKEIAEQRSEPLGTALSKLHRGLKKLRDLMEG